MELIGKLVKKCALGCNFKKKEYDNFGLRRQRRRFGLI